MLGRPDQVAEVYESLRLSEIDVGLRAYFLISPDDVPNMQAVSETEAEHTVVPWHPGPGDYALKMNLGVRMTSDPWIFLGARDLRFHPGWAEEALRVAEETGKRVIGTNDLANPLVKKGRHSTHSLVARSYIEELGTIDELGKVVHEGYGHNWVDNELIETAVSRGEFAPAPGAHVEHLHYIFRKGENDDIYERGQTSYRQDMNLFRRRRKLWARGAMRAI